MPTATKKTTTISSTTPITPPTIQSREMCPNFAKSDPPPDVPEAGGAAGFRAATGGTVVGAGVAASVGAAVAVGAGVLTVAPAFGSVQLVPLAASVDAATQKLAAALALAVAAVMVPQYLRETSKVHMPVNAPPAVVDPLIGAIFTPSPGATDSVIDTFGPNPDAVTL